MPSFLFFFAVAFFAVVSPAYAGHSQPGFQSGNQLGVTYYSGQVVVQCRAHGEIGSSFYSCRGADVQPGSQDRFAYGAPIDADKVELTAVHADGSTRTKSKKYDAQKGESGWFNLAISTLTQRPLLKIGDNMIHYKMKKKSQAVAEGDFQATMTVVGDLSCRRGVVYAWGQAQCDSIAWACDTYFAGLSNSDCQ